MSRKETFIYGKEAFIYGDVTSLKNEKGKYYPPPIPNWTVRPRDSPILPYEKYYRMYEQGEGSIEYLYHQLIGKPKEKQANMSMNLKCKEFDLPQIGSYASLLIFSRHNDPDREPDGGMDGVLHRLLTYWRMRRQEEMNREYANSVEQRIVQDYYNDLIQKLDQHREKHGELHFYIS